MGPFTQNILPKEREGAGRFFCSNRKAIERNRKFLMGQGMLLGDRIYVAQATRQPALASCILGL